ncbi:MAG: coproporphyrinogen dehydrogenase HemZ [Lachnospirales bacterium]
MNIFLKNHSYFYEVQSVLQIFFPNIIYNQLENENNFLLYDFLLVSEYIESENSFETIIYEKGKKLNVEKVLIIYKNNKRALKISTYKALCLYSKMTPKWGILTGIRPTKILYNYLDTLEDIELENHLIDNYLIDKEKATLTRIVAKKEKMILEKDKEEGYHMYINIPFCKTKCIYCSFTSFSIDKYEKNGMSSVYVDNLIKELEENSNLFSQRKLKSIYIGGGTPSSIATYDIDKLLKTIEKNYDLSNLLEYTFEAGRADTITFDKLNVLKKYKVNRISINPQTMNNDTLKAINRNHSVEDFLNVYNLIKSLDFEIVNVDLIYGLVGENMKDFKKSLGDVMKLEPESITIHTLSVKRGSTLKDKYDNNEIYKRKEIVDTETLPLNLLFEKEYSPYYLYRQKNMIGNSSLENTGFSKKGFECLYNVISMEETEDIVGFGAGATSKRCFENNRLERTFNVVGVEEYILRIDEMIERKRELFTL